MKVPVLTDIVRSVEKQGYIKQSMDSIYLLVLPDWSLWRVPCSSNKHNVVVFPTMADVIGYVEFYDEESELAHAQIMNIGTYVHQCPEHLAWRDDDTDIPKGKTWWAVTRMIGGSQATTQFSDFTEAEKYYNTHGENPGTPKQLIKMEVAREWEG